jgi:hypothetical protein
LDFRNSRKAEHPQPEVCAWNPHALQHDVEEIGKLTEHHRRIQDWQGFDGNTHVLRASREKLRLLLMGKNERRFYGKAA